MNIRKNNGITLVALVITIVLLLIIAGISITGTIRGEKQTKESVAVSELNMVQHAILERKTKAQLTKEELPGQSVTSTQIQQVIDEIEKKSGTTISLKGNTEDYKLLNAEALQDLGMENYKSEYIVNYSTGEVIDITIQVTEDGEVLYIN